MNVQTTAHRVSLSTSRQLILFFATAIILGTFLLLLPVSFRSGTVSISLVDALFTATSAVCVTGLVVRDTGSEFSFLGQLIILSLIQLGGLGILTFSNIVLMARFGGAGLRERVMLTETVGVNPQISPRQLVLRVFQFVFLCEAVGAIILTWRFAMDFPFGKALWLGVFHAVSAFCNAGFSLFNDSLIGYRSDLVINFTIIALIISGGLGFVVAGQLTTLGLGIFRRRRRIRLSLHVRVVLAMTGFLIVFGWLAFWLVQLPGSRSLETPNLWLESLFFSVTARTAGFNTVDVSSLSNAGIIILMLLMMVGGSPGSTAGGIKTTTVATLLALIWSRARNRPRVEMFGRTIPHDIQGKALAAIAGFFTGVVGAIILLELVENATRAHELTSAAFLPHLFEVISALATVGLSTGLTADLTAPGKSIIIVCMFVGRLGPLIIANSLIGVRRRLDYSFPEERLMVG